jgi:aspartate-semialdehyde dehydrogenase
MKIALVGATGLVGSKMLEILEERHFPVSELLPVASERSVGKLIEFKGQKVAVISAADAIAARPAIALFSAGGETSKALAEKFAEAGTYVIDNSSAWRMVEGVPLVIPEVNPDALAQDKRIIANPNCSTIQMLVALKPLHDAYQIKRIVVSTYQSVTGTGVAAVNQMMNERNGIQGDMAYPHKIDMNVLPHIDVFMEDGSTKEEQKMVNETKKMLDSSIEVTATCVRIPTIGGHSEAINLELAKPFDLQDVISLLEKSPGVIVQNNVNQNEYPMPLTAHEKDAVFVGRIRRDQTLANGLNLWVVSDNLRKGAATNAVQIAELLVAKGWVKA